MEQVAEEVDSLKESLDKHSFRQQKRVQEAKERAELLERAVRSITPLYDKYLKTNLMFRHDIAFNQIY